MGGIIESRLRPIAKPPEPVLDDFPHDLRIPRRPDAAQRRGRRQAAAERRRADGHGEQPIVVVNRTSRRATKIDVDAVREATGPHGNA